MVQLDKQVRPFFQIIPERRRSGRQEEREIDSSIPPASDHRQKVLLFLGMKPGLKPPNFVINHPIYFFLSLLYSSDVCSRFSTVNALLKCI